MAISGSIILSKPHNFVTPHLQTEHTSPFSQLPENCPLHTLGVTTSSSRQSAGSPPCSRHRCHNRTTLLPQTVRHVAHVPHDLYGFLKSMRPKDIYSPRTYLFIPDSVWRWYFVQKQKNILLPGKRDPEAPHGGRRSLESFC